MSAPYGRSAWWCSPCARGEDRDERCDEGDRQYQCRADSEPPARLAPLRLTKDDLGTRPRIELHVLGMEIDELHRGS